MVRIFPKVWEYEQAFFIRLGIQSKWNTIERKIDVNDYRRLMIHEERKTVKRVQETQNRKLKKKIANN